MRLSGNDWFYGETDSLVKSSVFEGMLEYFVSDCCFVSFYDISRDMQFFHVADEFVSDAVTDALDRKDGFVTAFLRALSTYIHPDDREELFEIVNPIFYIPFLSDKKSRSVYFRWRKPGKTYRYAKVTVSKLDDKDAEPKKVIICCKDADTEYRDKLAREETHKRFSSGIYALSREYESVYYVNLDRDEVYPYNLSDRIEEMFGDQFFKSDYSVAVRNYISHAVCNKDKKKMAKVLSARYIIDKLEKKESFTEIYVNNDDKYCEMKCVRILGEHNTVVMGFAIKDDEIRTKMEAQLEREFAFSLIDGLSREYNTVWLLRTDRTMKLYRSSEKYYPGRDLESEDSLKVDYRESMEKYVEDFVVPEDKERVLAASDYDNLCVNIPDVGIFSITFNRIGEDGSLHYVQICYSKAIGLKGELNIVMAFRDVDDIIKKEIKQREMYQRAVHERDTDGLTGIYNRFCYERRILEYSKGKKSSITAVYIDADGLHELNNTKGHEEGDLFIKYVARSMSTIWGKENVYRIGGDEFLAIYFLGTRELAENRIQSFKNKMAAKGYSASIGYSFSDTNKIDMRAFVKEAEEMMYEAKKKHYSGINDRRRR